MTDTEKDFNKHKKFLIEKYPFVTSMEFSQSRVILLGILFEKIEILEKQVEELKKVG